MSPHSQQTSPTEEQQLSQATLNTSTQNTSTQAKAAMLYADELLRQNHKPQAIESVASASVTSHQVASLSDFPKRFTKHYLNSWVQQSVQWLDGGLSRLRSNTAVTARPAMTTFLTKPEKTSASKHSKLPPALTRLLLQEPSAFVQEGLALQDKLTQVCHLEEAWQLLLEHLQVETQPVLVMLWSVDWEKGTITPLRDHPAFSSAVGASSSSSSAHLNTFLQPLPLGQGEHPLAQATLRQDTSFAPLEQWQCLPALEGWLIQAQQNLHQQFGNNVALPSGFFTLPLMASRQPVALLTVGFPKLDGFSQQRLSLLYHVRHTLAQTFWNFHLRQTALTPDLEGLNLEGAEARSLQFIQPVLTALQLKDAYTFQHSQMVALLAEHLGFYMGLETKEVGQLRLAALLHDVGKLVLPDHILKKEGRLTGEEWEQMRLHPAWGAHHVLASVPSLEPILPWIYSHHERWDGGGYPLGAAGGLRGSDIPFGARFVAVVDAYHAMTSDRPYRKAMTHERASQIMREEAGRQFDPMIVEAFLSQPNLSTLALAHV
jgi:HD-GYP domain-containing protein (c-di-GMP phosphodiesterase class II)